MSAEKKEKKKKEKTSVVLPKAWQSLKHRNETAQAKSTYEDTWKAIQTILIILVILFVLLGGVSQTGVLKFVFNWSTNVGQTISDWLAGGSIITNEDGIYWDPTGQQGNPIGGNNSTSDKENSTDDNNSDTTSDNSTSEESSITDNSEVNIE